MKTIPNPEQMSQIVQALHRKGKSLRQIARTLSLHRKTVKRLLTEAAPVSSPTIPPSLDQPRSASSKLDPFMPRIEELSAKKDVTARKIFQILRAEGYTGGRTIVVDKVRELRGSRASRKAFIRFETPPGLEAQMDWSPYTLTIDGRRTKIHLFSMILASSRFQYMEVFDKERQDTLFQGHLEAFEVFEGVPAVILYDNQAPVTPGRLPSGLALFHPRFESFAAHYGFQPKLCLPGDPERKGKVERPFSYFETNFLPLQSFSSLKDLRRKLQYWLNGEGAEPTGNFRLHSTTRRRPVDMWAEDERKLLIPLPSVQFMPTRIESRLVGKDCLISVLGNNFTVPPAYVGKEVTVLMSPKTIKVYNADGQVVGEHQIPAGKGHRVVDPAHYAQIKRAAHYIPASQLDVFFLKAFPSRQTFLEGLKRRLNSVAPIHLRQLRALLNHFTLLQVDHALETATSHGIFTVTYVEDMLKTYYPSQTGLRHFDERTESIKGLKLGPVDPGNTNAYDNIFNKPQ